MSESPLDKLVSLLVSTVRGEGASSPQPLVLTLKDEPTFFYYAPRRGSASERLTLEELIRHELRWWRPAGELGGFLRRRAVENHLTKSLTGWHPILLRFLACFACRWAWLLAQQMGAPCGLEKEGVPYGSLRRAYQACLQDAAQSEQAFGEVLGGLIKSMRLPRRFRWRKQMPELLQFTPDGNGMQVRWLGGDGTELCHESLDEWVRGLQVSPDTDSRLRQLDALEARQPAHLAIGEDMLRQLCPKLVDGVAAACQSQRLVGYTVCPSATINGLPAQVFVYVSPGIGPYGEHATPAAHLVALGACEEFVLQNSAGRLFYFPPIQLVARVEFHPTTEVWSMSVPLVRMPEGGLKWIHPYTGTLSPDWLGSAQMLNHGVPDVMMDISDVARQLLPARLGRVASPAWSDMCLNGQDHAAAQISMAVRKAEASGNEPNLLGAVWALWHIVSTGLTHGHMRNTGRPRVSLDQGEMYYPIHDPGQLKGASLARRIFPYDPHRPFVL